MTLGTADNDRSDNPVMLWICESCDEPFVVDVIGRRLCDRCSTREPSWCEQILIGWAWHELSICRWWLLADAIHDQAVSYGVDVCCDEAEHRPDGPSREQ